MSIRRGQLSLNPQRANGLVGDAWYYEEPGGLGVYLADNANTESRRVMLIPWRSLTATMRRYAQAKAKAKP